MNNFGIGFKRFISNKNVVTVLGVVLILGVLYFGYSSTIKSKTEPINVPVAAEKINPKTKISDKDVVYKQVAGSMVDSNVLRNSNVIIGMYTNINVTVPKGSPFYTEWLVEEKDIPGSWIEQLNREEGEEAYYMNVDIVSTFGNSVLPNTYIDIYMKAADENGTVMFGKLLENVKVLVVHDANGNDIFANTDEIGTPSNIGFAVNHDLYMLLEKVRYLNVKLVLSPRGHKPPEEGVMVASSTLRDYIDAQTITVAEDEKISNEDPNGEVTDKEKDTTKPSTR